MYDVEGFAEELAVHHKGYVVLLGTLGAGNDADAVAAQYAEELAGDTGVVLHVLADDGDGGQAFHELHGSHGAFGYLMREFAAKHLAGLVGLCGRNAE